ncbi:MAG TPA: DUF2232 domain-containing protein [bacterium]|nr:DUF2232 domain-containing protein [bacterium]
MLSIVLNLIISFTLLLIFFAVMGLIMMSMIRKGASWAGVVGSGLAYAVIALALFYFGVKNILGHDIGAYLYAELNNNLETVIEHQEKRGASAAQIESLKNRFDLLVTKTLPSWIFVSVLFMVFLNYFVVKTIALKRYNIDNRIPPFPLWRLNERAAWAVILLLALALGEKYLGSRAAVAGLNGVFIMANIYFFIGLAVTSFYLMKYRVAFPVRVFLYMLIVFVGSLTLIMMLTGILDTWFNFRRIERGKNNGSDTEGKHQEPGQSGGDSKGL